MQLEYFIGDNSEKFKEWCQKNYGQTEETTEGKWVIYDSEETSVLGELSNYVLDRGLRVWSSDDSSLENVLIVFGPSRSSVIPLWTFQYPGKNITVTSENLHDSTAKNLTATDTSTTPNTDYVLKWFKD